MTETPLKPPKPEGKPQWEKMSKSRGNVVLPQEVVHGVEDIDKGYEFRLVGGELIDHQAWGVWRDKLDTGDFFTSTRYGRQPVYLMEVGNPVAPMLEVDSSEWSPIGQMRTAVCQHQRIGCCLMLGRSREEVVEALGEPDSKGVTSRKYRCPSAFLYGRYEIHFGPRAKDKACMVFDRRTETPVESLD